MKPPLRRFFYNFMISLQDYHEILLWTLICCILFTLKFKTMKRFSLFTLLSIFSLTLTSCEAVGTVFEAGKWYGIIIAVIVVAVLFFLFGRGKK